MSWECWEKWCAHRWALKWVHICTVLVSSCPDFREYVSAGWSVHICLLCKCPLVWWNGWSSDLHLPTRLPLHCNLHKAGWRYCCRMVTLYLSSLPIIPVRMFMLCVCLLYLSCVPPVLLQWKYLKRLALCSILCLVTEEYSNMVAASCSLLLLSYIRPRGWEMGTVMGPKPRGQKNWLLISYWEQSRVLEVKLQSSPHGKAYPCVLTHHLTSFALCGPLGPAALALLSGTEVRWGLSVTPLATAAFKEDVCV